MIETAARNERWIVLAALSVATATGLFLTIWSGHRLMSTAADANGAAVYVLLLFVMWWTMMLAMMLPSAAPAILAHAALSRRQSAPHGSPSYSLLFASGYALVWTAFSVAAVILQLATETLVPLTGMMAVTSAAVGGALLIAAGVYQLTPLKYACLRKCQMPLMYLARNWRKGHLGAVSMGISHGVYCLGCCWVLMGLLFYGGVMELFWIVGLAAYVAAEKLIPAGSKLSRLSGVILIAWGLYVAGKAAWMADAG
jgi:predicted metal-binding membrane protein